MIIFDLVKIYDESEIWIYAKYSFYLDNQNFTVNSRCFSLDSKPYEELLRQFLDTYDILLERIDINSSSSKTQSLASLIVDINL